MIPLTSPSIDSRPFIVESRTVRDERRKSTNNIPSGGHSHERYYLTVPNDSGSLFRETPLGNRYVSASVLTLLTNIAALAKEPPDINAINGVCPSPSAIFDSQSLVKQLEMFGLLPSRVSASAEGGLVFGFRRHGRYAGIEVSNDGEITGLISNYAGKIEAWEIDMKALKGTVNRIGEHLKG